MWICRQIIPVETTVYLALHDRHIVFSENPADPTIFAQFTCWGIGGYKEDERGLYVVLDKGEEAVYASEMVNRINTEYPCEIIDREKAAMAGLIVG